MLEQGSDRRPSGRARAPEAQWHAAVAAAPLVCSATAESLGAAMKESWQSRKFCHACASYNRLRASVHGAPAESVALRKLVPTGKPLKHCRVADLQPVSTGRATPLTRHRDGTGPSRPPLVGMDLLWHISECIPGTARERAQQIEVKLAHTPLDLFGAKPEIAIEASITRGSVSFLDSSNKDSCNGCLLDFVIERVRKAKYSPLNLVRCSILDRTTSCVAIQGGRRAPGGDGRINRKMALAWEISVSEAPAVGMSRQGWMVPAIPFTLMAGLAWLKRTMPDIHSFGLINTFRTSS
jgi:hypothetical protein